MQNVAGVYDFNTILQIHVYLIKLNGFQQNQVHCLSEMIVFSFICNVLM